MNDLDVLLMAIKTQSSFQIFYNSWKAITKHLFGRSVRNHLTSSSFDNFLISTEKIKANDIRNNKIDISEDDGQDWLRIESHSKMFVGFLSIRLYNAIIHP